MESLGLASVSESLTIKDVYHRLDKFTSYVVEKKSLWSKAASIFTAEYSPEFFDKRAEEMTAGVFTIAERNEISRALIRRYDKPNRYHCDQMSCGDRCLYSIHPCDNEGCTVQFSLKYRRDHDEVCPFKIIPCFRECGESTMKRAMKV
jgi:homogentisate solanesyltransferase